MRLHMKERGIGRERDNVCVCVEAERGGGGVRGEGISMHKDLRGKCTSKSVSAHCPREKSIFPTLPLPFPPSFSSLLPN